MTSRLVVHLLPGLLLFLAASAAAEGPGGRFLHTAGKARARGAAEGEGGRLLHAVGKARARGAALGPALSNELKILSPERPGPALGNEVKLMGPELGAQRGKAVHSKVPEAGSSEAAGELTPSGPQPGALQGKDAHQEMLGQEAARTFVGRAAGVPRQFWGRAGPLEPSQQQPTQGVALHRLSSFTEHPVADTGPFLPRRDKAEPVHKFLVKSSQEHLGLWGMSKHCGTVCLIKDIRPFVFVFLGSFLATVTILVAYRLCTANGTEARGLHLLDRSELDHLDISNALSQTPSRGVSSLATPFPTPPSNSPHLKKVVVKAVKHGSYSLMADAVLAAKSPKSPFTEPTP